MLQETNYDYSYLIGKYGKREFLERKTKERFTHVEIGEGLWVASNDHYHKRERIEAIFVFTDTSTGKISIIEYYKFEKSGPRHENVSMPEIEKDFKRNDLEKHLEKHKITLGQKIRLQEILEGN